MIMKKLPLLLLLFIFACNNEPASDQKSISEMSQESVFEGLTVETLKNADLDFEKLRIYPITANTDFIKDHEIAENLKNLKEAMDIKGFRITEKKPYGRFEDSDAVNNLTVQNKSQDTIYLMAGDIVQGGKQDRVLAIDMIVPPRTIRDIPVFCVEPHRWEYKDENVDSESPDLAINHDHLAAQNKKVFAFTGYYNVASSDLRKTMKQTNDQQAVWDKVGELTAINNAESSTGAYANLENSSDFTKKRNEYIQFFTEKFDQRDDVIGMIAVSGTEVIAVDIFSHPNLFKKQYEVLIHSYITDAMSNGKDVVMSEETIKRQSKKILKSFKQKTKQKNNNASNYFYDGKLIHFTEF